MVIDSVDTLLAALPTPAAARPAAGGRDRPRTGPALRGRLRAVRLSHRDRMADGPPAPVALRGPLERAGRRSLPDPGPAGRGRRQRGLQGVGHRQGPRRGPQGAAPAPGGPRRTPCSSCSASCRPSSAWSTPTSSRPTTPTRWTACTTSRWNTSRAWTCTSTSSAYGPLPVEQACDYVRQTAQGLQHAHQSGLVHRDVKPANLFLLNPPLPDGEGKPRLRPAEPVVKILDWGLARLKPAAGEEANAVRTRPRRREGPADRHGRLHRAGTGPRPDAGGHPCGYLQSGMRLLLPADGAAAVRGAVADAEADAASGGAAAVGAGAAAGRVGRAERRAAADDGQAAGPALPDPAAGGGGAAAILYGRRFRTGGDGGRGRGGVPAVQFGQPVAADQRGQPAAAGQCRQPRPAGQRRQPAAGRRRTATTSRR